MVKLLQLPGRPDDWDSLIRPYATKTLFHESCWLDHILTIRPGSTVDYFRIVDGETVIGYFCALRVRKFLLKVYGSPLPGTGTNYMGPIIDANVDKRSVLRAILQMCRAKRISHIELSNDWFDQELMKSESLLVHANVTHMRPLEPDVQQAWSTLKGTCRNRIGKAEKAGLKAELTDDPSIVANFFEQFTEVYAKQGMVAPWGIERPQSLYDHLMPANRLFPVWVKYEGRVIATGLFPHDERAVYFWGAASWLADQHLCPNELLHWEVLKLAISQGIPAYNMCGGTSQFKDKFGGADVPYLHYSKSFMPLLDTARNVYSFLHYKKLRIMGMLRPSHVPRKVRIG